MIVVFYGNYDKFLFVYYEINIYRNDLFIYFYRFMAGVVEEVFIDGNGFFMVFIGLVSIII